MKLIENTKYKSPDYYDKHINDMKTKHGINVPESSKTVKCPFCGYVFNIIFGRAIACQGCSKAATGCKLARCPKCDKDFPLENTISKQGLDRMSKTFAKYYKDFGMSTKS